MFRVTSVSWPEAEQLLWRTAFRVFASRLRALASLLLALERRRIAHPKAKDYANFQVRLQQGFTIGEMGSDCHFAARQSWGPNVRFGSKADIEACLRDVRFTPKSGHGSAPLRCPLCAKSRHSAFQQRPALFDDWCRSWRSCPRRDTELRAKSR